MEVINIFQLWCLCSVVKSWWRSPSGTCRDSLQADCRPFGAVCPRCC